MDKTVPEEKILLPKKHSFVDIFAGCGGLSLGLMQAGWDGLFAIEHDANAFMTLNHNLVKTTSAKRFDWPIWLPQTPHSVTEVLDTFADELKLLEGKVDMLVGGPPCQGFSSAGRRDPTDPRNKLVEAYLEFVDILKPKLVLIENVKGITHDFDDGGIAGGKINYANRIIDTLSADYVVSSQTIDTSMFGVPQRRKRFFIIATKKGVVVPEKSNPFHSLEQERMEFLRTKSITVVPVSSKSAISDLEVARNGTVRSQESPGFDAINYLGPRTKFQRLLHGDFGLDLSDTRLARHQLYIIDRFAKIISSCKASGRLNISLSSEMKASLGLRKSAIRVLDPDAPAPTITSMPDDLIHYDEPRTLTVRENARLQSFPDWFAFQGKYTSGGDRRKREVPRFTQVANAVPPLMAEALGRTLARRLDLTTSPKSPNQPQASQPIPEMSTIPA